MSGAAQPHSTAARKGVRWRRYSRRDPSDWITIQVKYTGGPEAWWMIRARGETNGYPGWTAIHDLFSDVNQSK